MDVVQAVYVNSGATYPVLSAVNESAKLGQRFEAGPKKPRLDALGRLTIATIEQLRKELRRDPTVREIWRALPVKETIQYDAGKLIIQERKDEGHEEDCLWWRFNGREKKTRFKSFQNRLTTLRKKI